MLRNHLLVVLRSLRRSPGQNAIHVLGLGVGLAVALIMMAWVQDELSYDRFHANVDRIQQVLRVRTETNGSSNTSRNVAYPIAAALETGYPDLEAVVATSWEQRLVVTRADDTFRLGGYHVGPRFFDVFGFRMLVGNPDDVLLNPDGMVVSASTAERFFGADWRGRSDVIGASLRVDERRDFTVTGVFEDVPSASSLKFDVLLPFDDFAAQNPWVNDWGNTGPLVFARLVAGSDPRRLTLRIADLVSRNNEGSETRIFLQSFADVHLWTEFERDQAIGGRIEYVRVLSVAALLVLLIAGINFTNLATARSAGRAREVGIRKAIGGTRGDLVRRFLGESVLIATLAGLLAVLLISLLAPVSASVAGKHIGPSTIPGRLWVAFAGVTLLTGLLAGLYPALVLSAMASSGTLRPGAPVAGRTGWMRQGLVVVQFAATIVLILASLAIRGQIDFIRESGPGYEREGLVTVLMEGEAAFHGETFAAEFSQVPGIRAVAVSNHHPLSVNQGTSDVEWPGKQPDEYTTFSLLRGSLDLAETLGIPLVAGRYLSVDRVDDLGNFLINETAARRMRLENPVGTTISYWGRTGQIVGVLADFHFSDYYREIAPLLMGHDVRYSDYAVLRVNGTRVSEVIAAVRRIYESENPGFPFEYSFLDDALAETYRSDGQVSGLAGGFTIVALLLSLVGLVGITLHATQRRAREIGIRKVLGATVTGIVGLFTRDLLRPVVGAALVGLPLGYLVVQDWLSRYAYHAEPSVAWFVVAPLVTVVVGCAAVWAAAGRAASANVTETIRHA